MPDEKPFFTESVGVALARGQIASFSPNNTERFATMGHFNIVFPRIPDMLMNHASSVQRWVPAKSTIPGVFMPRQAN